MPSPDIEKKHTSTVDSREAMETWIKPLKGERKRGILKSSKDPFFSKGEQKAVSDTAKHLPSVCLLFHSQNLCFLSFSF